MAEIRILPYSPNMMFPNYILGCYQELEYTIGPHGELKITGIAIVKNESLNKTKRVINKKYGIGGEEKMNKQQLFEAFNSLFPDWAKRLTSYKKIGSKTLALTFLEGTSDNITSTSRVFLYVDQNNWHFGTKLWRKRPMRLTKNETSDPIIGNGARDLSIEREDIKDEK